MKKRYIKPTVELFEYVPEEGFALSITVALQQETHDYVLIEGSERSTMQGEDVTEFTDAGGQFRTGEWE